MDCEQAASQLPASHHIHTHNDCSKTIDEKLAKLTLLKEKLLAANSVEPLVEAVSRALSQSASQAGTRYDDLSTDEPGRSKPPSLAEIRSGSFNSPNLGSSRKRPAPSNLEPTQEEDGGECDHNDALPPSLLGPPLMRSGPLMAACGSSNAGSLEKLNSTMTALKERLEFQENAVKETKAAMARIQGHIDTLAAATLAVALEEAQAAQQQPTTEENAAAALAEMSTDPSKPSASSQLGPSFFQQQPGNAPMLNNKLGSNNNLDQRDVPARGKAANGSFKRPAVLPRASSAPVKGSIVVPTAIGGGPVGLPLSPSFGPEPQLKTLASRIQKAVDQLRAGGGMAPEQAVVLDGLLRLVPVVARMGPHVVGFTAADVLSEIARVLEFEGERQKMNAGNNNNTRNDARMAQQQQQKMSPFEAAAAAAVAAVPAEPPRQQQQQRRQEPPKFSEPAEKDDGGDCPMTLG